MGPINKNKHSIESADRKQIEKWLFESDKELQWIAQQLKNKNEELVNAQEEITATKDFLQSIVDSVSEMIISIDLSGKINQWNKMRNIGTMLKSCHISKDRLYRKSMAVKYLAS